MYDDCGVSAEFMIDPDFGTGRPLRWYVCGRHVTIILRLAHERQRDRGDMWICAIVEPIDGAVC